MTEEIRTDEELLAERQQEVKNLAEQQADDLLFVMGETKGRRFIWDLLTHAGVFEISYTGDNNATNFKEGRRSEGLRLFSDVMRVCPDLYLKMAGEAKEDTKV